MPLAYYINKKYLAYDIDAKKTISFDKYSLILAVEVVILPLLLFLYVGTKTSNSYLASSSLQNPVIATSQQTQVLGAVATPTPQLVQTLAIEPTLTPTIILTAVPTLIPIPTNTPVSAAKKRDYKIAIIGDSMVDTMGERLEYLEHALKRRYPGVNFTLYNFGKGAENVEMGLTRLGSELHYQDRNYPALTQVAPDILIVGSFAYNPFTPYVRDRHWVGLTKMIEEAKKISPSVYLLAEIAPLRAEFGRGPNGVNWDNDTAYIHSGRIIEQLENAVGLAKTLGVPLIDAFRPSGGSKNYVNPSDGIHPSVSGHEFTAELIAKTLRLD